MLQESLQLNRMESRHIHSQDIINALRGMGVPDDTIKKFLKYHKINPDIWTSFEEKSLELIRLGQTHYGAGAIAEIIRYERIKTGQDGFKINNNFRAYYARVFEIKYPEYLGFFETRTVKGIQS